MSLPFVSSSFGLVAALAGFALAGLAGCTEPAPLDGAACNVEHPCPSGFGCTGGSCRKLVGGPVVRCTNDDQCPVGRCLVASGFCVQCIEASDCVASTCLPDLYQCGCRRDDQCATGRCNEATASCLSCFADEQCASGDCNLDSGICHGLSESPTGPELPGRIP